MAARSFIAWLRRRSLAQWIFFAIASAVFVGLAVPDANSGFNRSVLISAVQPVGELFLRLLKMVIVPLIFSSIVAAVVNIDEGKQLGRLGAKTVAYYLASSSVAILIGLVLVNLVQPGVGLHLRLQDPATSSLATAPLSATNDSGGLSGFFMRMIPANPFKAMVEGDMLALIFFAVLLGIFARQLEGRPKQVFADLTQALFAIMTRMTGFVILFAPIGVFALVTGQVATHSADPEKFVELFSSVAKFFAVVVCGLCLHALVVLPASLRLFARLANPYRHLRAMSEALLTAFATASSNATLPLSMRCVKERSGVSDRVVGFVLPLGATVNMDGTALYECVVVVFIAQAFDFGLSLGAQVLIVVTALLTSVGVAGVPMASLVAIVIILRTVGMEAYLQGIALIMITDRMLDMLRTAVNVWSDSCGAVIIARSEGESTLLDIAPKS